jgi:hypothetical protein
MIFQSALIFGLLILIVYAVLEGARSPIVAFGVLTASVCGILLTVAPELANNAAHLVGVGRGADLIFYCFTLITLAVIFNLHLKLRLQRESLTEVVRALAISGAVSRRMSERMSEGVRADADPDRLSAGR